MFLLILESLGSTELFFILVMALVFFGPRKLPQISRTVGKSIADFRRASEDFKRTWDKEVSLEETGATNTNRPYLAEQNSVSDNGTASPALQPPEIGVIAPERVIARQAPGTAPDPASSSLAQNEFETVDEPKHSPKSDWL